MKVLVACEESQAVCKAFRERGHEAYSCDIQECSGGHPEWHILGDCLPLLNGNCSFITMDGAEHYISGKWDLLIAHPPCTYMSNAGARWLYPNGKLNQERYNKGIQAKNFFMRFYEADCERICIENPQPSNIFHLPNYTQIIQPYYFGEPYSKKTLLWLKGLPKLNSTNILNEHIPFISTKNCNGASRAGGSSKARSKTFPGIAKAMSEQWG